MFQGFSPATIDFLWGIRFNNNREWFAEHKQEYLHTLYEPMKELSKQVGAAFGDDCGLKLHLSRIYRDMRMHPPTFYKDSLWFCLCVDGQRQLEQNLCFEVRPEGYRYGFLMYTVRAAAMEEIRKKILAKPDEFLRLVEAAEKATGIRLEGDRYARPKPCSDERLAPYFGMKNFMAIKDCPPDDLLYSPELADEVIKTLLAWLPLSRFFQSAV